MALISLIEIWRMIVMSLGVGFIFSFMIERRRTPEDIVEEYKKRYSQSNVMIKNILFATMIAAPGIVLHELAHKFVAMSFGLEATFYASYFFLALAIVLILVKFPFVFFVPGYVSISSAGTALTGASLNYAYALIAFAGPLFNLVVFLFSWFMEKNARRFKISKNAAYAFGVSKKINLFLFVFNLLPIPGFDGWSVYSNLWQGFIHV